MAQVRHSDPAVRVALDDDLVLLVVPACAIFNVGTEVVGSLGGHVAELLLGVGHEALSGGVQLGVAELGGLVLVGAALDDAGVLLEALGEPLVTSALPLGVRHPLGDNSGRVLGLEGANLAPRPDGGVLTVRVELHRRALAAVVVQRLLRGVVAVELGPVDLEGGSLGVAVAVNPSTEDIVVVLNSGNYRASIVPERAVLAKTSTNSEVIFSYQLPEL